MFTTADICNMLGISERTFLIMRTNNVGFPEPKQSVRDDKVWTEDSFITILNLLNEQQRRRAVESIEEMVEGTDKKLLRLKHFLFLVERKVRLK